MAGGGGNENYQVSFVDGDNVISTVDVDKNSYVKEPTAPTKDGYIFAGWYADSAFTKTFDFKNTKITSDTKIYAKFVSEDEKFTVSFNSNGGSTVASQTVNAGEKAVKPTDPTKANSIFAGWYCDADLTEAYDFNTPVLSNITLYAKWTAESGTFTVTFNSNGGTAVPAQTVKAGEKAVKPANPTKSGFTFSGWYSDATLTTQYNFNSAVTANITLYAKWTTSSGGGGGPVGPTYYTVTFDPNEGKFGDNSTTITIRVESGKTIANLPEVTRPGFAFLGWNTSADGSGEAFTSTKQVTSNCTVYAQWYETPIVTAPGDGSDTTAEVTTIGKNLAEDLVNNADGNSIVFDASFENTDSVKISKDSISELNSAMNGSSSVNSLTFKTNDGSVTLNSTAVSSLVNSSVSNITIEVKDVKGTLGNITDIVGNNPVFEVSITDGTNEISLDNGSELTITVTYDENSIDPKNCKVFYVKDDGTIAEAYDVEINEIAKTITFTTGHNSYYAILPPEGLLNYTLVTANAWLKEAKLDSLFILKQDESDSNKIKLIIDVSKMFSNNNSLQNVNSGAFDNFLTDFGNFVELIFNDSSLTLSVEGLQDRNVLSKGALNDDAIVQFVYDLINNAFYTISNMSANSNNEYPFKAITGTLDGTEFTLNMVFVDRSDSTDTRNYIQEIKNFASKIDEHLEIAHVDSSLVIKFKAPDALLNYAVKEFAALSDKNYSDLTAEEKASVISAFDSATVSFLLGKMDDATLNQVFGSQQHAVNRVLGILLGNETFIDKVLSEVSGVELTDKDGKTIELLKYNPDFAPDTTGSDNWQKFIKTLASMLSDDANNATPGSYKQADGTYKVPVKITLDMKDELKLTNTTNMDIVIIMDIFPSEEKSPVELTVEKANKWLKDSNLDGLFNFKFNSVTGDVTIMIDADYVFGNNNELGNITPGAFDGFLTNIGKFINDNFSNSTLSLKIDNNTQTVLNNGSLSGDGLKGLVFGLLDNFFVNIETMNATAGNIYEFKTINATLDGKSFNIVINFTGDRMDEIITFAGKINENLELTYNASANDLTVKVTAPDALLNYAVKEFAALSDKNYSDLTAEEKASVISAFDSATVSFLLGKMDDATLNQVFGSQQHAVNRVLGILLGNETFIDKVLSEVSGVELTDKDGKTIELLKYNPDFAPDTTGSDNWQKFIKTLASMLSDDANNATPGSYKQADGTYKVPVKITLDLQEELSIAPLDVQIIVILNIFPEVNQ